MRFNNPLSSNGDANGGSPEQEKMPKKKFTLDDFETTPNRTVNPLAPNADGKVKSMDIESAEPAGKLQSKWKVVRKKYDEYQDQKQAYQSPLNENTKRMLSRLRSKLLDEDGKPNPKKILLLKALQRKEENDYDGYIDQLANELFIWMSELFAAMSPGTTDQYYRITTYLFTIACVGTYLFMIGDYSGSEEVHEKYQNGTAAERFMWLVTDRGGSAIAFDTTYLIHWGARYLPRIKDENEDWRWFTNMLLHEGMSHLFTNMIMYFMLSYHLERKYGWWRLLFVILLSGLGGNFLSAALEKSCSVYVGFSGVCFGLFGLFVADMMLNYETVKKPKLKILTVAFFFLLTILQIIAEGQTSHVSHVGGLLCGLFPSFVFLPNFSSERWEVALPPLGILTIVIVAGCLPVYVYQEVLPKVDCAA